MKGIIPTDTRYVPLVQQPACCVPTAISIVMMKLSIPLISQELLGYHLGLRVNKKVKSLFWNTKAGPKPGAGYGTRILDKKYNENLAFKKLNIPLRSTQYPIQDFKSKKEIIEFISNHINKNHDIIVFLRSGILNDNRKMNGHACVIDRIYPKKNTIRLIDPAAKQAKWREFKMDKFIKAIKLHPTNEGRFFELSKLGS